MTILRRSCATSHRLRVAILLGLTLCLAAAETWKPTTWTSAPAWTAEVGQATVIVAPAVGRLVWFGPTGGGNLLFMPPGGSIPVGGSVLHGGHQCWLGPQARWVWPPPAAWEAGALTCEIAGARLTLHLPADPKGPALTRTYTIEGDTLRCSLSWADADRGWHAMHVVQVPKTMVVDPVTAKATPEVPNGCRFAVDRLGDVLPEGCTRDGDRLTLRAEKAGGKAFLPQQDLRGRLDGWILAVLPGGTHGKPAGLADLGMSTQVMLTIAESPYIELEQCSDLLLPGEDGIASVDMLLRLERP